MAKIKNKKVRNKVVIKKDKAKPKDATAILQEKLQSDESSYKLLKEKIKEDYDTKMKEKKHELYVTFKKSNLSVEEMELELKNLHDDIVKVRFPRRGVKQRMAWLIFRSEEKATSALAELKGKEEYIIRSSYNPAMIRKTAERLLKNKKGSKKSLRKLWKTPK